MALEQFFRMGQDPHDGIDRLPDPPPWRGFAKPGKEAPDKEQIRGAKFRAPPEIIEMVNAALILRRPLLVTGKPGTGKSSLAYAVAQAYKARHSCRPQRTTLKRQFPHTGQPVRCQLLVYAREDVDLIEAVARDFLNPQG